MMPLLHPRPCPPPLFPSLCRREAEELRLEEEARRAKGPWGWLRRGKKVPGDS